LVKHGRRCSFLFTLELRHPLDSAHGDYIIFRDDEDGAKHCFFGQ
jgi:hypothetical protein